MSIDGFLACLALLVAIYTIASPVAKLRFRLLGWRIWLPSLVMISAIFYLLLFKYLGLYCYSPYCAPLVLDEKSKVSGDLAFVIVVVWVGVLAIAYGARNFSIRNYSTFRSLVEQLLSDRRYGELVELIDPHINRLAQRATRSHWFQRCIDAIRDEGTEKAAWVKAFAAPNDITTEPFSFWPRLINKVRSVTLYSLKPILYFLPREDEAEENASLVMRRIFTNEDFVRFISQERPSFALKIMSTDRVDYYEFSDRSIGYMIAPPAGPLRQELSDNDKISQGLYVIHPHNPIINFLFRDSKVAERLEVYRPVGEFAIHSIVEDDAYRRFLNSKPRDIDKSKKNDSLFLSCHFFDIMIRSAARDKIEWHMWLYYMNFLVSEIVKIIDVESPEYDREAEFPNYAHFIIYTIIRNFGEWIELYKYLKPDEVALQIENVESRHESGHIVKSAILSVGICLKILIKSEKVTDEFIAYILEIILRILKSAQQNENGVRIAAALTNSILEGGPMGFGKFGGRRLLACFHEMDYIAQADHGVIKNELERRYA